MTAELGEVHASEIVNPEKWSDWGDARYDRIIAVLLYGSWNVRVTRYSGNIPLLISKLKQRNPQVKIAQCIGVKVDADDESYELCIDKAGLAAPSELPAIAFVGLPSSTSNGDNKNASRKRIISCEHVSLSGHKLDSYFSTAEREWDRLLDDLQATLSRLVDAEGKLKIVKDPRVTKSILRTNSKPAIRLFIAGDRSQVGKSSICMGILGALLKSGKYSPSDLAYIKPATQCEKTQLVQEFCRAKGISACVPIGPIVYYKGFTRAFLKGEIDETSEQLLIKAGLAVDELAAGKKVVIIDGVGYPAVGSITGTDNASVAKSCGIKLENGLERVPVPVLLIGKSGVGDAVDSFNINATYFTHRDVPVIGAIFNKLSLEGFYSLENCKEAIEMYFNKFQPDKTAFGFIPEIPLLKNARENIVSVSEKEQLIQALETADAFVDQFRQSVNVEAILKAVNDATGKNSDGKVNKRQATEAVNMQHPSKQSKLKNSLQASKPLSLTRAQIEAMATAAGAAGG